MQEIDLTARSDESMRDLLRPAARALRDGALVVFPTTTYYALGADAMSPEAVRRVFSAKKRDRTKPLIALVDSFDMAKTLVGEVDSRARELDWRLGSRGLTYVLRASPRVPEELSAGGGTVAFRVERHEVVQELLGLFGGPVTGPSANLEGQRPAGRLDDAVAGLRDWIEVAVRWWPSAAPAPTTIVDLTSPDAKVVREGTVSEAEVAAALAG
jgi:L-threonylcarbamoyladenylate synthase